MTGPLVPASPPGHDLLGRDEDLAVVTAFVRQAVTDGGPLIVAGAPGMGKTSLLDVAASVAESAGTAVVRATGNEFLLDLTFATLAALVQPLAAHLDELEPVHQQAIAGMLGHEPDAVADQLLRCNAVLALFRRTAEQRPLLLVVDDLHWADRASAVLLGFVARRLSGTRVGLLGSFRTGVDTFFGREGLPYHELEPLSEAAAAMLLSTRYPMLGVRASRRVLAEAQGNPLALLELPQALTASLAREPAAGGTAPMPLSRRLHDLYAGRVQELPGATKRLLLLAALESTGDVAVIAPADDTVGLADLAPAERAGLVVVDADGRRVSFRYPLIRSTVVHVSSAEHRRSAHRALAEVAPDPVRRAHHLAEATEGPDEGIAAMLERSADEVLRRGDAAGAFTLLLKAVDLTPLPEERSRRLAVAAYVGADVAGELRTAAELLVEARRTDPSVRGSLRAAVAASQVLLNVDGEIDMAHRLLVGALHETAPTAPGRYPDGCEEALLLLLELCLFAGRPDLWRSCRELLARFQDVLDPVLHVLAEVIDDPAGVGLEHVRVVEEAVREIQTETDPRVIEQVSTAAWFLDRGGSCRDALWRLVRDGRSGGAVASAIGAMTTLASDAYYTGQWEQCELLVEEGLQLCAQHGYDLLRWPFLFAQAMLSAARGELDTVPRIVVEIDAWAAPRGLLAVSAYARQAEVLAALGAGDAERAYEQARAVCEPGTLPVGIPQALFLTLDLVLACTTSGRPEEARGHVEVVRAAGISHHAPRLQLLTAAATAVVAEPENAEALYRSALALSGVALWPFDAARIQLLLGEHLHRLHGGDAGQQQLQEAYATMRRLRAAPWTARAAYALRASGAPTVGFAEPAQLSAQELEIARLAAAGLTNREIGDRLHLSHRTVGAHLYRIFPKLGITTRMALRDALARASQSTA